MTTDIDPSKSFKEEIVTAHLRWNNGVLQQKWILKEVINYSLRSSSEQWRDIPIVDVPVVFDNCHFEQAPTSERDSDDGSGEAGGKAT